MKRRLFFMTKTVFQTTTAATNDVAVLKRKRGIEN